MIKEPRMTEPVSPPSSASGNPPSGGPAGQASAQPASLVQAARSDRIAGLVIVAVAFLGSLGISTWAKDRALPEPPKPPAPPTQTGVFGWPKAVDAIKNLAVARQLTERPLLRGIVAEGVRYDGTINVKTPSGRVRYSFQSPPGQGTQPLREPGTLPSRRYCGRQSIHINQDGMFADPDSPRFPCASRQQDPLPEPRCSLADVWKSAVRRGAPKKKRANIEYYRAKAGPAWRFRIPHTKHSFALYGDCERVLSDREASGSVP